MVTMASYFFTTFDIKDVFLTHKVDKNNERKNMAKINYFKATKGTRCYNKGVYIRS
jgi:hypothetical protein